MQSRLQPTGGHRARPLRAPAAGFTLVEILTSTAIMALLVSLVMTILSQVVTAWNSSSDDLYLGGNAHKALDIIASDLQGAIFRSDSTQWLASVNEPTPNCPIANINNTRLIFFTSTPLHQTKPDNTTGASSNTQNIYGDVCAIEYRVTYADPFGNQNSTQKTFSLHRVFVDPASTLYGINGKAILGIFKNNPNTPQNTLQDTFDALFDSSDKGTANTIPGQNGNAMRVTLWGSLAHESIMLDNVARFTVFLYYYGTAATTPAAQVYPQDFPNTVNPPTYYIGGWQRTPQTLTGAPTSGQPSFLDLISTSSGSGSPSFSHLAYADITLTILTDEGVDKFNQFSGSLPQGITWDGFLDRYGKTYTQRVQFFNSP